MAKNTKTSVSGTNNKQGIGYVGWVLIIAALLFVGWSTVKRMVIAKSADFMAQQYMTHIAEEYDDDITEEDKEKIKNLYSSLSNKEKSRIQRIVGDHISMQNLSEMQKKAESGDTEALKEFANQELSEHEKETLLKIYMKYMGEGED